MNSQYGSLGAEMGYLPCKAAAAAVTATGRNMILKTKEFVEKQYGAEVIYGDSVAAYTPVLTMTDCGLITVVSVEHLCVVHASSRWARRDDGKDICVPSNCMVWTEDGWTRVQQVVRHRRHTHLIRVSTGSGLVDVTPGHSLLLANGETVRPNHVQDGDTLLHSLPAFGGDLEMPLGRARAVGERTADTGVFPPYILTMSLPVRQAFWDGFRKGWPGHAVVKGNQVPCAVLYCLARSLGMVASIDRDDRLIINEDTKVCKELQGVVKSVRRVATTHYVYDLTTKNHHFQAGVGNLIVHNTDSVFIKLPDKTMKFPDLFRLSQEIAERASALFPYPVKLEFENTSKPCCLKVSK